MLRDVLEPAARVLVICAGAALLVALVNLVTAPVIEENESRGKNSALRELTGGAAGSEARPAFPLAIDAAKFESALHTVSFADKLFLRRCYELSETGIYRLKKGLAAPDLISLSEIMKKHTLEPPGTVRAWYRLGNTGTGAGYILELSGSGYGGPIDILALYDPDGTVRRLTVITAEESPAQTKQITSDSYWRHFAGTKAGDVPVVKSMLKKASVDAISGATISFMAVAAAVKEGSLYVIALGGDS
jgi:Na+-translocating ferredoxin:NAD+ oxidoreductase RnfG subunit